MSEERDQILKKLRELRMEFGHEYRRHSIRFEETLSDLSSGLTVAWSQACGKLKDLIDELDPDSLTPVELPLKWHSDFHEYLEACREASTRGMSRRCVQCSKCKTGMEVEIVVGEPCTKKRLQCTGADCGHVQVVSLFQGVWDAKA